MGQQRFRAVITAGSGGRALITVPFDPDETWGAKANHPVGGTIDGWRFRGRLSPADREIFGVPDAPSPIDGSAIVEWTWGLEAAPETNTPTRFFAPLMRSPPWLQLPPGRLRFAPPPRP